MHADSNLKSLFGKNNSSTTKRDDSGNSEFIPAISPSARIAVVGVGGGGCNAVNRMVEAGIQDVDFIAVNTDAQALYYSKASHKVTAGKGVTKGLGAGANPQVGKEAAEESSEELRRILDGYDMIFVTCGLGGGTGTGGAPILADIARELDALTVAVVTKPFSFEGAIRKNRAEEGMKELAERVDTTIVIPNDNLLAQIDKKTPLTQAFTIVDDVLRQGIQGISDLITVHGLINLDFADVKAVMKNAGSALMGIGFASGENRAKEAAEAAINSPLLGASIQGAKGVLINITGGNDLSMFEVDEAAKVVSSAADPEANVIFGAVVNEAYSGELKITVIATGFEKQEDRAKSEQKGLKNAWGGGVKRLGGTTGGGRPSTPSAEDDLEVPAFLRKTLNK